MVRPTPTSNSFAALFHGDTPHTPMAVTVESDEVNGEIQDHVHVEEGVIPPNQHG